MPKIDPWKFVEKDKWKNDLRPALGGVYYKNGYVYATDSMVLVKFKSDYPKSYEGKIMDKNGNQIRHKGNPVTKYPNADAVIPDIRQSDEFIIDIKALENALSGVEKPKKNELIGKKLVIYPEGYKENELENSVSPSIFRGEKGRASTPGLATYNAWLFKKAILPFMKASGANHIYMDRERSDARGALITNGTDIALIMPLQNYDPSEASKEPETIVYKTKEVGIVPKNAKNSTNAQKPKQTKTAKTNTNMKRTTKKSTSRKAATTMRDASRILKAQKDDYQKIFAAEVKKSKDPKAGAKKAGKIYRDRYGATATARWKKALKRAK